MRALVAGATGFVGARLVDALAAQGTPPRCIVRNRAPAELELAGCEVVRGDLTDPGSLEGAGLGVDVAYYLVHMMGDDGGDFAAREQAAAIAFGRMAAREGIGQVIYLGGLGDEARSEHLQSRHATAQALRAEGPPLCYFRASMIVGAGGASFRLLRDIVERLPFLLTPDWLQLRTQPIGLGDVIEYLIQAPGVLAPADREIQIGGPDVLTYEALLDEMARALGKDPMPRMDVRGLGTESAGAGVAAITDGDDSLAAALTESLGTETIVTDPSAAERFAVDPEPLALALSKALDDEDDQAEGLEPA